MATKPQGKFVKPGVTVAAALIVSLLVWETGGKYMNTPQPVIENTTDKQWCAGITGPGTTAQAHYTDAECDVLLASHLHSDVSAISKCLPWKVMPDRIRFAAAHMAYNIGPPALCRSSMAKRWRTGDFSPASCSVILRYTYVAGQDCRVTGKRCPGIVKRRDYEHGVCTGQIDWREQAWKYGD